jgi:signal transduction histidine kinase
MAERLVLALGLLGICGAVGGLLAGYGITRGLLRSLVQLQVPVRSAAGKLNEVVGPITLSAGRDLEDLGDALERIAEQVGTVVERLQCSQRELLRGEQLAAVGQLAAGLAHELRNPLMAMKLLVQTAVSRGKGALAGRDLDVLLEEIGRMERWIANFLDFARPPRPEKRDFEVRGVIDQVARLVSPRAESQGVVVRRDGHAEPVVAHADPGQFRQLLLNLMLNALDASPGGGVVRIGLSADEGTGGWMTVQVADSGCGLPDDLGPRIFEPFVSRKETGTGLGLSISKQIVEAHGGTIEAAGGPGGGAVFTARIPLAGVEPAGRSQEASDANPAGGR